MLIYANLLVFARFGIPDILVSDNTRQFICAEFRRFANTLKFKHIKSSPHYPQSKGKAENAARKMEHQS